MLAAGALASVRHLKSSKVERERQQERAAKLKALLREAGLPVMPSPSHIVPVLVGDPARCKDGLRRACCTSTASTCSRSTFPTVPRGTERLRFTPSPFHDDDKMDALVEAIDNVWSRLNLRRAA